MTRALLVLALLLAFAVPARSAEFLILAFDTYGGDVESDRFAWKIGHIVDVRPDGANYGTQERLPKFWIVKVPGITVAQAMEYLEPKMDQQQQIEIGIRKWKLDANAATAAIRTALTTTGVVTVSKTQALNYIKLIQ